MEYQVNSVRGTGIANIGGEYRVMAIDMRAAEYLWGELGDLWPYWLAERLCGRMIDVDGQHVRVVDQIPKEELSLVLLALLSSDRENAGRTDTAETILEAVGEDLLDAQKMVALIVQPCFALPGKGISKEKRSRRGKKKHPWDWKRVMGIAFGPLRMSAETFWSLTLPEWIAYLGGYSEIERRHLQKLAWLSRNQLIAAGAKPNEVTVAKLMGEPEPRRRRQPLYDEETRKEMDRKKIIDRIQKDREKRRLAYVDQQPAPAEEKPENEKQRMPR